MLSPTLAIICGHQPSVHFCINVRSKVWYVKLYMEISLGKHVSMSCKFSPCFQHIPPIGPG